jgi:hypothetical protein
MPSQPMPSQPLGILATVDTMPNQQRLIANHTGGAEPAHGPVPIPEHDPSHGQASG